LTDARVSPAERLAAIRLVRSEKIGPVSYAALLARFGTATKALAAVPELARRGGRRLPFALASEDAAERELEAAERIGAKIVLLGEDDYPELLAAIDPPPPLICTLGNGDLLHRECVAVVGARNASAVAQRFTRLIASDLGQAGFVIVSGLARGIDAAAHQGSLATGTIAVLAGGVDNIYPPDNKTLYAEIVERGAIVSEMPIGFSPVAAHFPRRNRIISGLSRGTVVVEAAIGSGSLITARFALEQNREVFAVPGSPLDPRCRGANNLIREGATITEAADDVVNVLRPMLARAERVKPQKEMVQLPLEVAGSDQLRRKLLELLSPSPTDLDDLLRRVGASEGDVLALLLELELAGQVARQPGRRIVRI
jgi:DNA processing protein